MKSKDCLSYSCAGNKCLMVVTGIYLNVQHQYSKGELYVETCK